MKTIYFVRHGESEANVLNLRSGSKHSVPIPLTKKGRQQAEKTGARLKNKDIDLIVCSPLIRTVDTAKIIAKEIGYDQEKIVKNPLFAERDYGIYDGKTDDEYLADKSADVLHESVEPTQVLHERILKGLDWLKSLKEERIVLVSHGGTGRMVQGIKKEVKHDQMHTMKLLDNAQIYEFTL